MPWKISFEQDTEIEGIGTARADYVDDSGYVIATYQGRLDERDGTSIDGFLGDAIDTYKKAISQQVRKSEIVLKLQAILNEKIGEK